MEIDPNIYAIRIETKSSSFFNRLKMFFMYSFSNCTILFAQSDASEIQLDSMKDKV